MITIAALFVDECGPYFGVPGVDVWGMTRDARTYLGLHPVIAHPPCERWGRYAKGGPSAKVARVVGADDGCFESAMRSVRTYGGVLEHPADSKAWHAHELLAPNYRGGWTVADRFGGWTCRVEQGHYGHRARKGTWLYANRCELPSLIWGKAKNKERMDAGYHSADERRAARLAGEQRDIGRLSDVERRATPIPFRDVLIKMARSVGRESRNQFGNESGKTIAQQ